MTLKTATLKERKDNNMWKLIRGDSWTEKSTFQELYVNNFDDATVKALATAINAAVQSDQPYLPIYIDSWGGSVYHLSSMISLITTAPLEVHTIVTGRAMSAGALLFCFGTKRFIAAGGWLMFHDIEAFMAGKLEDMKEDLKQFERLKKDILERAGMALKRAPNYFFKKLKSTDWFLDCHEAKKEKIATDIGTPMYEVIIETKYRLKSN